MNVGVLVLIGLVLVGVATLLGWYFSADQRTKRAMRAIPRRAIADVIEGEVARVVGTVRVSSPMTAPLSGRPCAYFRVVVEERRRRGKNSYWHRVIDEQGGVDFVLEDGGGRALVKVGHAQAVLEGDQSGASGFMNDPSPELVAFLEARGHSAQGWIFNKAIRYREGIAEAGELVAVVGAGRWERDPEAPAQAGDGYRDAVMPTRLVLEAPSSGPLLLSDEASVTT